MLRQVVDFLIRGVRRGDDHALWQAGGWKTVVEARNVPLSIVSEHHCPSTITGKVRVRQLPGGGPASRPHIMSVVEACLTNRGALN